MPSHVRIVIGDNFGVEAAVLYLQARTTRSTHFFYQRESLRRPIDSCLLVAWLVGCFYFYFPFRLCLFYVMSIGVQCVICRRGPKWTTRQDLDLNGRKGGGEALRVLFFAFFARYLAQSIEWAAMTTMTRNTEMERAPLIEQGAPCCVWQVPVTFINH